MYEKRWWIENLKVDVLPSAIAVDDAGKNILFYAVSRMTGFRLNWDFIVCRKQVKYLSLPVMTVWREDMALQVLFMIMFPRNFIQ